MTDLPQFVKVDEQLYRWWERRNPEVLANALKVAEAVDRRLWFVGTATELVMPSAEEAVAATHPVGSLMLSYAAFAIVTLTPVRNIGVAKCSRSINTQELSMSAATFDHYAGHVADWLQRDVMQQLADWYAELKPEERHDLLERRKLAERIILPPKVS